ncbi:MAG TPA: hypothetical protein VN285_05370 [Candidatus Deferrimicrobium sp.]|nr:hypothetical protein [Candidatus Deferrimicrobium sp.]
MRLYEFEGKEFFKKFNIPIPSGRWVKSPDEVSEAIAWVAARLAAGSGQDAH